MDEPLIILNSEPGAKKLPGSEPGREECGLFVQFARG